MGRYEAQHLFLKGSSLILYATVTSAEREWRRKHEERAEVNRVRQQREETEGTKQGHPKHEHSPPALPQHNPGCQSQPGTGSPEPAPCQLLRASPGELNSLPASANRAWVWSLFSWIDHSSTKKRLFYFGAWFPTLFFFSFWKAKVHRHFFIRRVLGTLFYL